VTGSAPHVRLQWGSARANNTSWPTNCSFRPCSMVRKRGWWASELRRCPVVYPTGSYGSLGAAVSVPPSASPHQPAAPRLVTRGNSVYVLSSGLSGSFVVGSVSATEAWNGGPRGLPQLGAHPSELRGDIGARPIHASV
jgi:hypothetical protein